MLSVIRLRGLILAVLSLLLVTPVFLSQAKAADEADVQGFESLRQRPVEIWSDGTRLAGDLFYPRDRKEGEKLPALVLCHGWGGVKAHLNPQIAPRFAAAGYIVLTFDYRGWGESDSRLVVTGAMPKPTKGAPVEVSATAIREVVDPFDQQEDIDAAISFILGEPGVDTSRIGIWGSSFGGGHVVWRAAHDDRVHCVVAQVGAMDAREGVLRMIAEKGKSVADIETDRTRRARGELPPVPQGVDQAPGLRGTPYNERFVRFVPWEHAHKIKVPVMLIDASKEHYFDIREHSGKVHEILKGKVPVEYHVLDQITHYGVYQGKPLDAVMALEIPWFDKHLKGK